MIGKRRREEKNPSSSSNERVVSISFLLTIWNESPRLVLWGSPFGIRQSFEFSSFSSSSSSFLIVCCSVKFLSLWSLLFRARIPSFIRKFFSDYSVVWLLFCFLFFSFFTGSCWYDELLLLLLYVGEDNKDQHASLSKRGWNYKPRRSTWWHNSSIWMMMMFWWKPGRCPDQLLNNFPK